MNIARCWINEFRVLQLWQRNGGGCAGVCGRIYELEVAMQVGERPLHGGGHARVKVEIRVAVWEWWRGACFVGCHYYISLAPRIHVTTISQVVCTQFFSQRKKKE